MKEFVRFALKTAFGPFVIWCGTALLLFAAYAFSPVLGAFGITMAKMMFVMLLVAAVVNVAAIVISLVERQSGRGLAQLLLALAGLLLFFFGFLFSFVAQGVVAHATSSGCAEVRSASVTNGTTTLEFAVEYKPAHPFLAEYDRCIVFPSGKRIVINMDTGGAGAFAVYRLPTGEYYLADGLEHDFIRNDYRVNTTNETVEIMCDGVWVNVPDKTLKVDGRSNDSISIKTKYGEKHVEGRTPVGDSLKGRVYVGLLYPSGKFEPGTGDPFADIIDPKWNPIKLDGGEVPFSLECRRWKGSHYYRLVFASGTRIALDSTICTGEGGYPLYALEDGRYHLFEAQQKDISWRKEWRIDAKTEAIEVMFKDHWGKCGDMWVKIPNGAISCHNNIGVNGGKDGAPLSVSIKVDTENGKVEGHDFVPVGDSLSNSKFIGTFQPPDDAPQRRGRTDPEK